MQLEQSAPDEHRRASAPLAMAESVDRRLATRDQVSELLLGQTSFQEFRGDFLEVHTTTLSRMCLSGQHQCDLDVYYIRDMNNLAQRLIQARERKGLTQDALAKLAGVSQSTIGNLEAGLRNSARKILDIAAALDVDPTWLANGTGGMVPIARTGGIPNPAQAAEHEEDGFITGTPSTNRGGIGVRVGEGPATTPIRAVKLRLQAGVSGFVAEPDMEIDHGYFQVPTEVIEQLRLNPEDLIVTTVRGRSMEPMMFEDDKVLVDTSKTRPKNNECFAVNWNGEPIVKCLIKKAEGWHLYSFNRDFPTIDVRSGQCSIIGMVVWQPARIVAGRL